ncbi:hypothetical protein T440DRAFT_399272 [Plenodomus tracheiphilus IPT5]|uniref:BTB domain-containing protein n=1 Tax=Plenodomus tracheiphilus IPT5 TaxID=1408161 RepID=A0A6A7B1F6_9PLEO|nr:hypothetical protein T440DRAFT_399272 [Plenodomus tracheiphilus IPT5]
MEEAHDTVEEDDVGHGGDNDEDFPCETVSLTSDDISRSDSSVEEFSDYPQKIFYIHKDVLCKTSGFFHAAMKQEWSAQRTQPIDLTDVNPDLFELYVQWLYSKKVSIQAILNEENEAPVSVLVKSYILGARLADSKYQKATMKTLFLYAHKTETYPDEQTMRLAYRYTLSFDPLRKLLIDFWVCKASVTWSDGSLVERLGIEIANELIKALIERRPAPSLVEG